MTHVYPNDFHAQYNETEFNVSICGAAAANHSITLKHSSLVESFALNIYKMYPIVLCIYIHKYMHNILYISIVIYILYYIRVNIKRILYVPYGPKAMYLQQKQLGRETDKL